MITWTNRKRPAKRYEGHDLRRTGRAYDQRRLVARTYAECECGKVYSGWGEDGGFRGWMRHRKTLGLTEPRN